MPTDLVGKKVAVSVLFDTVSIEVICGDGYLAQVLCDDLIERLRSGQGITLALEQPTTSIKESARDPDK